MHPSISQVPVYATEFLFVCLFFPELVVLSFEMRSRVTSRQRRNLGPHVFHHVVVETETSKHVHRC